MVLTLALAASIMVITAWSWLHCAQPALASRPGSRRAQRVVLAATVVIIATYAAESLSTVTQVAIPALWWVTTFISGLWIMVVAIGYLDSYRTLLRITRGRSHAADVTESAHA